MCLSLWKIDHNQCFLLPCICSSESFWWFLGFHHCCQEGKGRRKRLCRKMTDSSAGGNQNILVTLQWMKIRGDNSVRGRMKNISICGCLFVPGDRCGGRLVCGVYLAPVQCREAKTDEKQCWINWHFSVAVAAMFADKPSLVPIFAILRRFCVIVCLIGWYKHESFVENKKR